MLETAMTLPAAEVLILNVHYYSDVLRRSQMICAVFKTTPRIDKDIFAYIKRLLPGYNNKKYTLHVNKLMVPVIGRQSFNSTVLQHCFDNPMYTPLSVVIDKDNLQDKGWSPF